MSYHLCASTVRHAVDMLQIYRCDRFASPYHTVYRICYLLYEDSCRSPLARKLAGRPRRCHLNARRTRHDGWYCSGCCCCCCCGMPHRGGDGEWLMVVVVMSCYHRTTVDVYMFTTCISRSWPAYHLIKAVMSTTMHIGPLVL